MSKCYLCINEAHSSCYRCKEPICEMHSTESQFALHMPKITCVKCAEIIKVNLVKQMGLFGALGGLATGIIFGVIIFLTM